MNMTDKVIFTEAEETKEKTKYFVNFGDKEFTLKDMVTTILEYEYEDELVPSVTLYVNRVDCDGDNVSRMIKYVRDESGMFQSFYGSVFLTEYGSRPAYCSTCEVAYADCSVEYYITLDEPAPFTKEPSETKTEDTDKTLLGGVWKWNEQIEDFVIPDKATILKEFITKFLTKMDDIAPERREDCEPQTPWESYLLARDDMMRAILDIMLEG
jgi:hypothetical protein